MQQVAEEAGMELQERRFGETLSFELVHDGQQRFSFQIAVRSLALGDAQPSAGRRFVSRHWPTTSAPK